MYQVDYYSAEKGSLPYTGKSPTARPTSAPTASPTVFGVATSAQQSPSLETQQPVVRYGVVVDRGNGNYSAAVCPVIAGVYEIHVLYRGFGVSNQPFRILDKVNSYSTAMGRGSYQGQYVDKSPYALVVGHTAASSYTSTAFGYGIANAVVGVPATFVVTVRDPWDNVLRSAAHAAVVTAVLDRSPTANVSVWSYQNGSFLVEYVALVSGPNPLTVKVNGGQIAGSPFLVAVTDDKTSSRYSYAQGSGLYVGIAGDISYFEVFARGIDNVQRGNQDDSFVFTVNSAYMTSSGAVRVNSSSHLAANRINGTLRACPSQPLTTHPACSSLVNASAADAGHYFGSFVPTESGLIVIHVYLNPSSTGTRQELHGSPFSALISPSNAKAESSIVRGTKNLFMALH
jgi:hypothetical protein